MSLVKLEIRIVQTSLPHPFLGLVPNLYFPLFLKKNTINSLFDNPFFSVLSSQPLLVLAAGEKVVYFFVFRQNEKDFTIFSRLV